jgi:hypothetical protein
MGNKIIVFGGNNAARRYNPPFEFDTGKLTTPIPNHLNCKETNQWKLYETIDPPSGRSSCTMFTKDKLIFVLGGLGGASKESKILEECHILDTGKL